MKGGTAARDATIPKCGSLSFRALREESSAAWMDSQDLPPAAHAFDPWVLDARLVRRYPRCGVHSSRPEGQTHERHERYASDLNAVVGGLGAVGANPRNPRNRFSIRVRSCRYGVVLISMSDVRSQSVRDGKPLNPLSR